ncbi:MAG: carboxymuconolactone decarboxylase family protein [Mariniphaga sp.]|nr:carboxymuconolactone decarboxylase family protein [Mariniphaga sp.]MDD4227391.1 carboxymuconolactone decarboxylase family protein [Mariniphaga sp.]
MYLRKNIKIPDSIGTRTEYKRKFSLWEMYRAFILIPSAAAKMIGNKRKKLVDKDFVERLQLAVTEVNGCAACSYAHTYIALKQGMSSEEINSFLSGDGTFINQAEAKAIIFAQHYADTRGFPKKDAFDSLVDEYGNQKVKIILSAIQLMHAGNIFGIPYSALISRLKGYPYKDSSLLYELGMHLGGLVLFPIALVDGFLRNLMGFSKIRLDNSKTME